MNRINVNQIKQVGAFVFLYFLAIGLGVLVGNLVDHQGNMFYAPAFSALFGGTIYRYYLEKIKGVGSIFIVGCVIGSFFLLSRHGAGRLKWSFSLEFTKCLVFCHFCLCDDRAHSYDVVLSSQLPHVVTGSW